MKKENGITLVALVISIIVLLILATVSIQVLTGDNGLLTKASQAKEAAEIGEEKEIISLSLIQVKSEKYNENLDEETFQTALNNNSKDENKAEIIELDEEGFIVRFERTKHCYEVNQDGNIDLAEGAGSKKTLTINCKDSNGTILATENYTIYKSKYSKKLPTIEGYIPEQETISGEITGDTIKEVLYYYVIPETQMVFTGLDSSGNITTDSNQIDSYMVGNNSSTKGNGLVSAPTVLSALIIPETHEGKPIIKVGTKAFSSMNKIVFLNTGNSVTTMGTYTMSNCTGITKLIVGRGLNSIGAGSFDNLRSLKTVIYNNETNVISKIRLGDSWTEIQINEDNTKFKVVDNIVYSKDGTTLVAVPTGKSGSFTVAEGVTKIGDSAFKSCYKITEINIGNSVTTLGRYSMSSTGIKNLTIGSGLNSIQPGCFDNCRSLKTIIIDSSTIVANLSAQNSYASLIQNATTVYTKTTPGSYITSNFHVETSDIEGYTKYVKN